MKKQRPVKFANWIDPSDLKIEAWSGSGIKVIHLPTKIEACVNLQSQPYSKEIAVEMIRAALVKSGNY